MTIWSVLDRVFGVVVPMCMVGLVVMLWLFLSCPCADGPAPLRLRIVPRPGTEQQPPRSRRVDASWDGSPPAADLARRDREV